ncbi:hypothetical protein OAA66_03595, partial [Planktomarina temperata]|nr:hypothetical protein [Planktomarina temperata]
TQGGPTNLKDALLDKGWLDNNSLNQSDLQNYLDDSTIQFDAKSYTTATMYDLNALLVQLDYIPQAAPSEFKIDTSNGTKFYLDGADAATLQLNGVQFSDANDVVIIAFNLEPTVAVDLSAQDYSGATLVLDTWGKGATELTGVLDAGLAVELAGSGPIDITGITTDATHWNVGDEARLVLTSGQKAAILGNTSSEISASAVLSVETVDGANVTYENFRILTGDGDDVAYARNEAEHFVWNAGDGNDSIVQFDLINDRLYLDDPNTVVDLTDTNRYTLNGDGDRVYSVGSETVTLVRPVATAVSPFVVSEVDGGRWGDYITYEVKVGDTDLPGLDSIDLKLSWEKTEFEFVNGSLKASDLLPRGSELPNGESLASPESASIVNTDDADNGVLRLNSALLPEAGVVTGDAGTNVFEFMLKRIDPESKINQIKIDMVNYTDDTGAVDVPTNTFDFNFVSDKVSMTMETHGGLKAPNPKVYVADGTVMDGLSIAPIATHGDYTQYEIVYNVSDPAGTVPLSDIIGNQSYTLKVDGTIVQGTLSEYGFFGDGEITDVFATDDSVNIIRDVDASMAWQMIGFNRGIYDPVQGGSGAAPATLPTMQSLSVTMDAQDIGQSGPDGSPIPGLDEGSYALGSFIAVNDGSPIKFTSNGTISALQNVSINMKTANADALLSNSGLVEVVDDGSEVYLLGDHWYSNPDSYLRAVTAGDALEVLRMNVGTSMDSRTNAEIIAADFDRDGKISAMDAYEILSYSAHQTKYQDQDDAAAAAVPMGGKYMPEWFYIDNVEAGQLDTADIKFDKAIKEFVGADLAIDATAVLVGDVTASYKPLYSSEDPLSSLGKFTSHAGSDTHNGDNGGAGDHDGGAGGDTVWIPNIASVGTVPINNWQNPVASITLFIEDLNGLAGPNTFTTGDLGDGAQGGAFLQIQTMSGAGAATKAATNVAGTFIYDSNTGDVIFDVSGDTSYTDDGNGTGFTDASDDDIVFANLGVTGPDLIDGSDILFDSSSI